MTILQEFKTFAIKGNAVELAIGIVIGSAFTAITNSLVNDIINPVIGILTGPVDLSEKVLILKAETANLPAISLNYGHFLSTIINFLIIAVVLFLVVRQINRLRL